MNTGNQIDDRRPDDQVVEFAVENYGILADARRVRLILALRDGRLSVNELAKIPSAILKHLAKLRLARSIATRQDAQKVFDRLQSEHAS